MAIVKKGLISLVALISFIGAFFLGSPSIHAATEQSDDQIIITEWQMLWEQPGQSLTIEEVSSLSDNDGWFTVHSDGEYPSVPEGIDSAWIKFRLPGLTQMRPALELNKLFSQNLTVYIDRNVIIHKERNYYYDRNDLIVPISKMESEQLIYISIDTKMGRLGLQEAIVIDEYDYLNKIDIRSELLDIALGAALICISLFMIVCVLFLNRSFLPGWISLFIVMMAIGIMILSYSSFVDKYFSEYGTFFYYAFDAASNVLLPALFIFVEKIFGKGPRNILNKYNKFQMVFFKIAIIVMLISFFSKSFDSSYMYFSMIYLGTSVFLGNIILVYSLVYFCLRKNIEAIILSIGLGLFAIISLIEIIIYFSHNKMTTLYMWKFGIVIFLASLIVLLVKRIMRNYEQAVRYTKQIELFNNELQRSEKIEMISHLAASIAHEVRNPLQVTRGFLQVIGGKMQEEKSKGYMKLAIEELDRASEIITDFLTFAKPDIGESSRLDISIEIYQIDAILKPLATMNNGTIELNVEKELIVKGNSSKFKQALINIIKNSIEAFRDNGIVSINAFRLEGTDMIQITISDNGEGIEEHDLSRLGEPYYSKKSKGTGLGLMVTYRIIESMRGKILFSSKKGEGTVVTISLPILNEKELLR